MNGRALFFDPLTVWVLKINGLESLLKCKTISDSLKLDNLFGFPLFLCQIWLEGSLHNLFFHPVSAEIFFSGCDGSGILFTVHG
jgi:hypothetical protein